MTDTCLAEIVDKYGTGKGSLIPILQQTQEQYGYLSRENLAAISRMLRLPESKVFGVVTFYSQFHLKPRGKYIVRVCLGTACHVRGAETLFQTISRTLGIAAGETTLDRLFSLERVACLGACGLAPVIMVNEATHGRLTHRKVEKLLARYRREGEAESA